MTQAEKRLDVARRGLRKTVSSVSVQNLNVSSLGKKCTHESVVHEKLRGLKRAVAEHEARVTAERRLASLRRLTATVVSKRHANSLRGAEGRQVEDQSRWGDFDPERFKEKVQF